MKYNTQERILAVPEYGRAVQKMIDHAVTIEDRAGLSPNNCSPFLNKGFSWVQVSPVKYSISWSLAARMAT